MLSLCAVFVFLLFFEDSQSAPALAQPHYQAWRSEPRTRGTWSILSSCVITLTLCVYTAIHLNIFEQNARKTSRYLRRAKYMLVGLLAPEVVVFAAWRQWQSARDLTVQMKILEEEGEHSESMPKVAWTLTHSFFVVMGGFVINIQEDSDVVDINSPVRATLTPRGLIEIVERGGRVPTISINAIKDRSKADSMAKTLACLQAGYMIFQVVGRLAASLSITLLEINTIGHVVCALMMFTFWLKKPLNVDEPVQVENSNLKSAAALRLLSDIEHPLIIQNWWESNLAYGNRWNEWDLFDTFHTIGDQPDSTQASDAKPNPSTHEMRTPPTYSPIESASLNINFDVDLDLLGPSSEDDIISSKIKFFERLPTQKDVENWSADDQILIWTAVGVSMTAGDVRQRILDSPFWSTRLTYVYWVQEITWDWKSIKPLLLGRKFIPPMVDLDTKGLERWELAGAGLEKGEDGVKIYRKYVVGRAKNMPFQSGHLDAKTQENIAFFAVSLATGLYGGLHAAAWHTHFPTRVEQLLWRICALIIAVSGLIFTSFLAFISPDVLGPATDYVVERLRKWRRQIFSFLHLQLIETLFRKLTEPTSSFMLGTVFLIYCAARAFIVIEAFISLRSLPDEAYMTPQWTQWLPHL